MSYRVAIATRDNITIDEHFGRASSFAIFTVRDDLSYVHEGKRLHPQEDAGESASLHHGSATGCGCGGVGEVDNTSKAGGGCAPRVEDVGHKWPGTGSCGGGGCGSGGCGGGGGGGPIDPRIEKLIGVLSDVQVVIAGTLGRQAQSALTQRGIHSFAVGGSVANAMNKLVAYDKRQRERSSSRGRHQEQ